VSDRENLFRPVHKGIRSMIFETGLKLGTADFADVPGTNALAGQLRHDLASSTANCVLCLLYVHSQHEEADFFSAIRQFDKDVVDLMMAEHAVVVRRIQGVAKTCDELLALTDPRRRREVGDRLNLEANDLFAFYLSHLNNEEAVLVPVMWERFTDEQLRGFRAQFYNHIPLARFEDWMRWTLPALNEHELEILLTGMRSDPPPNRFADAVRVGREAVPADRWSTVERRLTA